MFDRLRVRCMKKDFSWDKSAERYNRMYEDICGGAGAGEPIPFEEAFDQLRHCYMENERTNRVRHESGYQRVVQITIIGRGAGTFTIRFNENGMQVEPTSASDAEAYVHCSFDNLLAMARGFVTVDKLYLSGQLRLSGNLSKGFEIRYLLSPAKQRA
ncbi:MAG: SCP2 sterol-binding domain-containing protein, partial [Christensenellales bacterium]